MTAPDVAPDTGRPDFLPPANKPVTGPTTKAPNGGDNQFEKGGGQMHVSGPGEAPMPKAYVTEKQSQKTGDSYF